MKRIEGMRIGILLIFSVIFVGAFAKSIHHPENLVVQNEGEAMERGRLYHGVVSYYPNGGLDPVFHKDRMGLPFINFFVEQLFGTDENYKIGNSGAAEVEFDPEAKTVSIEIKDNVEWHDGESVTSEDYIYALEVVSSKDWNEYNLSLRNVDATPINNRVKYYNVSAGHDGTHWDQVELVTDKPIKESPK